MIRPPATGAGLPPIGSILGRIMDTLDASRGRAGRLEDLGPQWRPRPRRRSHPGHQRCSVEEVVMSDDQGTKAPWLPPRWFIRLAWSVHRGLYRVTGSRVGLWRPREHRWGTLRLTATGRRTGQQRSVILAYFEDGPNLVGVAMNGWGGAPLPGGSTSGRTRTRQSIWSTDGGWCAAASPPTTSGTRLWPRWREADKLRRPRCAAIVRNDSGGAGTQIGGQLRSTACMRCQSRETTAAVRRPEGVHPRVVGPSATPA